MIPQDATVNRLMADTGMDRVQAIRHLRDRAQVQRLVAATAGQREGLRHVK